MLSLWRHVEHIVIRLNLLIEDKAEKRKCRGRGTGLCNLLLTDPSLRRTTCFYLGPEHWKCFFIIILFLNKIVCVITLWKLYDSISNYSVDDLLSEIEGQEAMGGRQHLSSFVPKFLRCTQVPWHAHLLNARLRLERHTSMLLSNTARPVCLYVSKNLDWPVYAWIELGRQSDRINVNVRMRGWRRDKLEKIGRRGFKL